MEKINRILKSNNLRVTPVREGLLNVLLGAEEALSSQDIESKLEDVDRITLYRTIKKFQEKGIIHRAYDGTDQAKYAACSEHCDEHEHHDEHVHFHCLDCGKTICVESVSIPNINMPEGFKAESTKVIVEGKCNLCE